VTAGTPDGPTLGRIAYEERLRIKGERLHYAPQPDYDALSDDLRAEWEAAGAVVGATAIARLGQPAELASAMRENVRLRKQLAALEPKAAPGNAEVAYEQWIEHRNPGDVGSRAGFTAGWQAAVTTASGRPLCPGGCGCRLGTDDADRRECGCDGGCCDGQDWFGVGDADAGTLPQAASELATLLADWRRTADSLKDRHGAGDARERNTLEVAIGQVEAILADAVTPQARPATMLAPVDFSDEPEPLSEHVAIRFPADIIAAVKQLATAEGMAVSAWIRREVQREADRREPQPAPGLRKALENLVNWWAVGGNGIDAASQDLISACSAELLRVLDEHREQPQPALGLTPVEAVRLAVAEDWQPLVDKAHAEADKYRELLDEIGVMAANAPEEGDSFGLLEEIAMMIAAADVPDTTPIGEWPDPGSPSAGRTPGAAFPPERHPPGADAGPNYGEAAYLDDEIGGMT